ncbi:hypothetical protein TRFO_25594 [Tritrichomonas foetus]|uniref:Uncharacterized protein n=1 Tax=Tritrichomonas foetus TaxID=1144522 RepID=A0A1J4K622_9EUKA|nr:hypothetical protein TRFO_25594 [Tritrichomonas foetus]|eukprot:OHT06328.1 hypothetical protein TRFO_25594 [Tritrichomonas foetus]
MSGSTTTFTHSRNCSEVFHPKAFMYSRFSKQIIEKPQFLNGRFINPNCGNCIKDLGFDCKPIGSNFYNRTKFRDVRRIKIDFGNLERNNSNMNIQDYTNNRINRLNDCDFGIIIGLEHPQGLLCDLESPHFRIIDSRTLIELCFCPFSFTSRMTILHFCFVWK